MKEPLHNKTFVYPPPPPLQSKLRGPRHRVPVHESGPDGEGFSDPDADGFGLTASVFWGFEVLADLHGCGLGAFYFRKVTARGTLS